MAKPKKIRKIKIPKSGKQQVANLEKRYKQAMLDMLADLFPNENYDRNSFFQRIAVTDIINPVNKNKEYGILFICDNTLFSVVEAFDGNLDAAYALGIEGLATIMDQCDQVKRLNPNFKYRHLKVIVYDNQPKEIKNQIVPISKKDITDQPIVLSMDEMYCFNKIFRTSLHGKFPVFVFNPYTNPEASKYFELTKQLLNEIPNTRVPRI